MSLATDPKERLRQFVADVRHRYDGDETIHSVMHNLTGAITWGTSEVATLQNIVAAIYDAADEGIRALMLEAVRHEHEEICACCRARAQQAQCVLDWQKAQVQ